ncbi:MAG TPA: glycosyl transferase family 90 [Chlamydiales bacterium]|nr:glycosyl transferase family 90 [Chlamydiales bacterium]
MRFFWLIFLVFLCFSCSQENNSRKLYYRHFKAEKGFLTKKFQEKVRNDPPQWMLQQIKEDLFPFKKMNISLNALNQTDAKIPKNEKAVLRYRIVNNQVYLSSNRQKEGFEPCDRFQNALLTLCRLTKVPNVDFIMNHEDGTDHPFYLVEDQAPIFGWAKLKTTPFLILVPDYRSVSTLWFDDLHKLIQGKNFSGVNKQWAEKNQKAFWRGTYTEPVHRKQICQISKEFGDSVDAGLTGFFLPHDQHLITFVKPGASYEEHMEFKYLPVLDGIMCSYPGFQWRLLSGCLTMKQESDQIQWFYRALKPFVHYVPIKNDLSDLVAQVDLARNNDPLCKQISKNAKEFVLGNLLFEDVYLYLYLALSNYAKCLDESVLKDLKKTPKNPDWVLVH